MKGKGIWKRWMCAMLIPVLFAVMPGTAFASQKPEWRYGKSIFVRALAEETRTFSPEDFPGINCKKVFVLSKYKRVDETKISYELVLMLDDEVNVKDAVEKVKQLPMVADAEENREYVMNNTMLTLNRSYLYLPVGGSENVWVRKTDMGKRAYSIDGIKFKLDSAYSEQISIEKDCFAKYGITYFCPEVQLEYGNFLMRPFLKEELEFQKSAVGVYHGLAGDENEYLFDAVARLAATPEIKYVEIVRDFICGEESYNANTTKSGSGLQMDANRIWNRNQYDDIQSMDNGEIIDYSVLGKIGKTLMVRGLKPGITTFAWERCEGDMYALTSLPVIVYEPGSKNNPGDIDHDGTVSTDDALLGLKHSVGLITLDEAGKQTADLNQDNTVNVDDAILMLKIAVGCL